MFRILNNGVEVAKYNDDEKDLAIEETYSIHAYCFRECRATTKTQCINKDGEIILTLNM